MFDIGGFELLLIAVVGLLVIGPERLPETLRTLGLWLGRLRRSFTAVKTEIEKEIGMDEVKRQLHNEAVMEEMQRIEAQVKGTVDDAKIDPGVVSGASAAPTSNQPAEQQAEPESANPAEEDSISHADAHVEDPEPQPTPRTEAELERANERKMRARQADSEDQA